MHVLVNWDLDNLEIHTSVEQLVWSHGAGRHCAHLQSLRIGGLPSRNVYAAVTCACMLRLYFLKNEQVSDTTGLTTEYCNHDCASDHAHM